VRVMPAFMWIRV